MMPGQDYAPKKEYPLALRPTVPTEWHFGLPPTAVRSRRVWLLTIGGIAIQGFWLGGFGEFYSGWNEL